MGIWYCICIFFLLYFFWFFVVKALKGDRGARNNACDFEDFFVKFYLNWERIDGVLYSFGPFAIMAFTNIAIIYKFIQAKLTNRRCGRTESTNHALDNAAMRGTAIFDYCDHDLHNTHCSCSNLLCNYT